MKTKDLLFLSSIILIPIVLLFWVLSRSRKAGDDLAKESDSKLQERLNLADEEKNWPIFRLTQEGSLSNKWVLLQHKKEIGFVRDESVAYDTVNIFGSEFEANIGNLEFKTREDYKIILRKNGDVVLPWDYQNGMYPTFSVTEESCQYKILQNASGVELLKDNERMGIAVSSSTLGPTIISFNPTLENRPDIAASFIYYALKKT